MNAAPLNDDAGPERAALIAGDILGQALVDVVRCTCDLCEPRPLGIVWRQHAQEAAIREALEHLRAGAPGRALEILEAAV